MNCLNISNVLEANHTREMYFFVYIYFVKLRSKACSDAQLFYITIAPKKFTIVQCKDLILRGSRNGKMWLAH